MAQVENVSLSQIIANPYLPPFSTTLFEIVIFTFIMITLYLIFRGSGLVRRRLVLLLIAIYVIVLQLFFTPYEYTTARLLPNGTVDYVVYTSQANIVMALDVLAGLMLILAVVYIILDYLRGFGKGDEEEGVIDL
ncbi:hypothetical protein ATV_gp51 [Bicaudavirus pozzuoliense]|uniref:Uncharacterized protein ORF134 n=2 Tax=Acidianus two-tailed virus TaxID=315953 RepID=Y134_ATV|nr:hypothetical protein ATV_gp51 [Acidianus two-tailed virus]Q3V4U5.1 RecName: Full=Uncharacterized protein ORF134 [Acidianus two-tailed virus]AON96528.1 hypothetical protein [Acidianus two-tailed phage variant 1]CAI59869.1 hypothetical protein [Acidianus two-tailed virus]